MFCFKLAHWSINNKKKGHRCKDFFQKKVSIFQKNYFLFLATFRCTLRRITTENYENCHHIFAVPFIQNISSTRRNSLRREKLIFCFQNLCEDRMSEIIFQNITPPQCNNRLLCRFWVNGNGRNTKRKTKIKISSFFVVSPSFIFSFVCYRTMRQNLKRAARNAIF